MEFERELLEQKTEFESKQEQKAKFNGRIEEWIPFWGKFISEIDSTDLAPLTKFGYLNELLERHVRTDIDGLPFTEEGYQNAKAILEAEYGQKTVIVNAHLKILWNYPLFLGRIRER